MENLELTAEEIGKLLTIDEINKKLNLFSARHKKILPETVHIKNRHLITLDLLPVQNSPVKLPVAFRSSDVTPFEYYRLSWSHEINKKTWAKGQKVGMACAMCDIIFNASVPRLYACLQSSLDHSYSNKKLPFVVITDRVKESFNHLPNGTMVVKTLDKYKKNKVELF